MVISIDDVAGKPCNWQGCSSPATRLAVGRRYGDEPGHEIPQFYCSDHAVKVADEGFPEYITVCANCGCSQGVN